MQGWIGVDLDATLAYYDGWIGTDHIGEPIPLMVQKIKEVLDKGIEVRIFTARASVTGQELIKTIYIIQNWLEEKCRLPRLEVTNQKDFRMIELWDDRARQVEENTGIFLK